MKEPKAYVRRPFPVQAIRVTVGNMFEVADWCKGEIKTNKDGTRNHIEINVQRPSNPRQTTAFPGDWVVVTNGNSYRVYSNKTFHANFMEPEATEE